MDDILKTALEALQTSVLKNSTEDGNDFLVIPENAQVYDLERLMDSPRRIRQKIDFARLDSFCAYVNEFKQSGTKIFLNAKTGAALACLDFHTVTAASWMDHKARFEPVFTESWQRWNGLNNQSLDQRRFALFVEDNALDISEPAPAEMLDIARTLTAKISVNFKKGTHLENGSEQIQYEETIDAKAGQRGQLEIPSVFTLEMSIFDGRPARRFQARLRYSIKEGVLSFSYSLMRPQEILNPEIESLGSEISNLTQIQPLLGCIE